VSILQGLAAYKTELYAAWKGEVGDDRLFFAIFENGAWKDLPLIPGASSIGPSLASFQTDLYAGWKGEANDNRLFYASFDGVKWNPQATIPGNSSTGPSLAVLGDRLVAAWKGEEADQRLFFATFDGHTWSAQAEIPGVGSSVGPSLATFDGKLYAIWKGKNNDQSVWYASFDGHTWSTQAQIPEGSSSVGPSLATFDGKLYAIWKGVTGDNNLYSAAFDGSRWSARTEIPGIATSLGAATAEFDGKLYALWSGVGTNEEIWFATFDGTNWSAQATLPGNTGQDTPQNIGLRIQYQARSNWCWIAVATSLNHFYDASSTATQCEVMSGVMTELGIPGGPCCPSGADLASNKALALLLADPYSISALYALDQVNSGSPAACDRTGGVGDALDVNNNWNNPGGSRNARQPTVTLGQIQSEIAAGRPIAVDIQWNTGGAHCVAIAGVLNDIILICDPIFGETVIQYEDFPAAYPPGAATIADVCLTQSS
jgi:hypothetical protein